MPVKVKFLKFIKKTIRWLWPSLIVITASCIRKSYFLSLSSEQVMNGLLLYAVYLLCIIPAGYYLSKIKWFEDESKTALLILFITYFFFEYSAIFSTWEKYTGDFIEQYLFNKQHTVFILVSIIVGISIIILLSKLDDNKKNRSILIFVTIVLTVMPFMDVLLIPDYKFESDLFNIKVDTSRINKEDIPKKIFWIILDEHPSSLVLDEVWGYKDTTFRKELESLGFTVYDSCVSSYNYTPFSIASTTYGAMLPINIEKGLNITHWHILGERIRHSPVMDIFSKMNYEIHNISLFNIGKKEFFSSQIDIIASSVIGMLIMKYSNIQAMKDLLYNKEAFDSLTTLFNKQTEDNKHIFVYAHLLMPHSPYTPYEKSVPEKDSPLLDPENEQAYLEHLTYTDSIIVDLLTSGLDCDDNKGNLSTLIILQSDHGYRFLQNGIKDQQYNTSFGILNAVFWKNNANIKFYNGMNSVNTFRILLRELWNIDIEILKDSSARALNSTYD